MKHSWKLLFLIVTLALVAVFCTTAIAADAVIASNSAVITVIDGLGTTASFNASNEDIIDITVSSDGLTAGSQYLIMMVKSADGETYEVTDDSLLYIDQTAAAADETTGQGTVSFAVYPSAVEDSIILITGGETPLKIATVAPAVNKFDIYGANMTLGNDLSMNFFVQQSYFEGEDYYATITHADKNVVVEIPFSQWETSGSYYKLTYTGLAAKEMADDLDVQIFSGDGKAVSNVWTDGVRTYAMRIIDKASTPEKQRILLVDMLNYGAAAQTNFTYRTDDLADNQLTEAHLALTTALPELENNLVEGTNYYGSSLSLKTNIQLNVYFSNVSAGMRAVISYTDHKGNTKEIETTTKVSGSYGYVTADTLVVADGFQLITFTVYDADGNVVATAVDSLESYCMRTMAKQPLNDPLMRFVQSAHNYFH